MNALVPAPLAFTPIEGELLGPQETLRVVAAMHPLKTAHETIEAPIGASIEEIVALCGERCGVSRASGGARVTIDGELVPRDWWGRVRPKAGCHVMVRAVPGKAVGNLLRSILSIALVVVAGFLVGPAALGLSPLIGGIVSAGIVMGGNLLLNSLFPPSQAKAEKAEAPLYSIASRQNAAARWGPIPVMLGEGRVAAKLGASPFTEFVGEDQVLTMLFVWGLGPLEVTSLKIGDTPIEEFDDVQIETFSGYPNDPAQTIYPSAVVQNDEQIEPEENEPVVREAADEAVAIGVDLITPQGIFNLNQGSGELGSYLVQIRVEILERGGNGTVVASQTVRFSAKSRQAIRRSIRIDVAKGLYAVRVTRLTRKTGPDSDKGDQVVWAGTRSYRAEPAIAYDKPLAITALRIRASKQLSGVVNDLTAIVRSKAQSFDGAGWVPDRATRNPADLFRLVLQGPGCARPVPNSRLDLPAIEAWGEFCRLKGFTFDMFRDFDASVDEVLDDVCAAGRAVRVMRDGLWSVAMEDVAAPIVQQFTSRNVSGFTRTITYPRLPHALRVPFVNRDKDWAEDERLVYDDGFDRTNATLFETFEIPGVTDPTLIFKHARYRQAEAKLRTSLYTFTVDWEHLICQRGDKVSVSHLVVHRRAVQGRVVAVAGQRVTLDEPVTMAAGVDYGLEMRRVGEAVQIVATLAVTRAVGTTKAITVAGTPPAVGDQFAFGPVNLIGGVYRVLRIRPGEDFTAEIELVDDAPGIAAADSGPIVGPPGSVVLPPPLSAYRPRALRAETFVETRPVGSVHVTRLLWQMVPPPNLDVLSFLVVALSAEGDERRVSVDGQTLVVQFEDLQSGEWTFRVHAYFGGSRISVASDPLTVPINIPWDQLGVGLGNVQPDIRYLFAEAAANWRFADGLVDELAALAAANLTDLELEAIRLNSRAFDLSADVEATGARLIEEVIERESGDEVLAARAVRVETRLDDAEAGLSGQSVALDSLVARTSAVEGGLESAAESLRGVRAEITDLDEGLQASGEALDVLQTTVTAQGETISSESARLTRIVARVEDAETGIGGLASDISEVETIVTQQGNKITSETRRVDGALSRIGTAESDIGKAESDIRGQASSITYLNTVVGDHNAAIAAQADVLQDTRAIADNASAGALMRIQTRAGPAGTAVRHSYQYRRTTSAGYQEAGWFVDLSDNGPPTVVFDFTRFLITDSTTKATPFRFENGTLFLQSAVVGSLVVEGSLTATKIVGNGISRTAAFLSAQNEVSTTGGEVNICSGGISFVAGAKIILQFSGSLHCLSSRGQDTRIHTAAIFRVYRNGALISEIPWNTTVVPKAGTNVASSGVATTITDSPPGASAFYSINLIRGEAFEASIFGGALVIQALNR